VKLEDMLPFGSIVSLKGGTRKVMIIGVFQIALENNKMYDYCGCAHPYGYLNSDDIFLFNHDKIEKIYFRGYSDEELKDHYDDLLWERRMNNEG